MKNRFLLFLLCLIFLGPSGASAIPYFYEGGGSMTGSDPIERAVYMTMTVDDYLDPVAGFIRPDGTLTSGEYEFDVTQFSIEIAGLGVFAGTSDYLAIESDGSTYVMPDYYRFGDIAGDFLTFRDSDGSGWAMSDTTSPQYAALAPQIVIGEFEIPSGPFPSFDYYYGEVVLNRTDAASVPEPAVVFFLGAGMLGLAVVQRKLSKKGVRF